MSPISIKMYRFSIAEEALRTYNTGKEEAAGRVVRGLRMIDKRRSMT